MNALFGSKKQRTTAYHPPCDGQVEKFNSTLLNMLNKHVASDQRNWDVEIPYVMMAYRCSVNETTGFSPAMLMFGHELRLPLDVVFGECPGLIRDETGYTSNLRERLKSSFEKVRDNITRAQKRQKDYFDRKVSGKTINVGDKVLLYEPAVKVGQSPKLHCPWGKEPFEVIQKVSEVDYKIWKGRLKPKIVHFNRLKVFVEPEEEEDERENGDVNRSRLPKRNGDVRENNRRTEIGEKTAREQQLAAPRKDGGCQKKNRIREYRRRIRQWS